MYYNLDDILAEGEKLPCRFNLTVPGLGYLEGNPGKPVSKGASVELPLWLAQVLATCPVLETLDESFVELLEPDFISDKVQNAIHADPKSLDLHSLMANYYKLVEKWAAMFGDTQLVEVVMTMLRERAVEIHNYASNTNKHINADFVHSLDEFEKHLFKAAAESRRQMREWAA